MGWRGTLRAIEAAQRRAERAAIREQRELIRLHKQNARMQELEDAAYRVRVYENHIERITSVHRDCGPELDWTAMRDKPEPIQPLPNNSQELAARQAHDQYVPGFFDKLFRRVDKRRAKLAAGIERAIKSDEHSYNRKLSDFEAHHAEWCETKDLANRILAEDIEAYNEAIEELDPFNELKELCSRVEYSFISGSYANVLLHVNSEDAVPAEVCTLLKSGKLSVKKMPISQLYDFYQDYVTGAVFRVARELFVLLPIRTVNVTAIGKILNPSTGHMEHHPVVSVIMPRETINDLNFNTLDPSDALRNFVHNMDFKKTKGFGPVSQVSPVSMKTAII